MTTKQQKETQAYFRKFAEEWGMKAEDRNFESFNLIRERNDFVLSVAKENAPVRSFLDVGCGTGDLVVQAAKLGIPSVGVDFAEEMIEQAILKMKKESGIKADFVHASIFDFSMGNEEYDLISANGFIEYISYEELELFFDMVARGLKRGGSFVCGSRNRLFNLFSLNEYTSQEIDSGAAEMLLTEAVRWSVSQNIEEALHDVKIAPLQDREIKHPGTGVEVNTRFQYTPAQLIRKLAERGLKPIEIYPVNIHGVTPKTKDAHNDIYALIANMLQSFGRNNTQMLTQASTFMLHVMKV